ncbi:MAG TPA: hypothetical protein VF808_10430 [Ktedonobacterales bacterium]
MIPEVQANVDEQPPIEQAELPTPPPPGAREEPRREEPLLATPPAPPRNTTRTRRRQTPSGRRWALSLGLVVLGSLTWFIFGWGMAWGAPPIVVLSALVPAVTCLIAGWLLRSWWGGIATAVVYVAASAVMWYWFVAGPMSFLTVEFALAVVLPAVVMAAIGTAIGMYRFRRAGSST